MNISKNFFEVFYLLSRNTYFNEHYLVAAPASTEQKHHWASTVYKQRHFYHLLKTPNYIALFTSPDDYDITVNRIEKANVLMLLMFYISRKQPLASVHFNDFDL